MTRCEKANRQTRAQVVVTCGCVKFKDTIIESHPISLPPESISILSIALAILIPTKCLFPRFWNILHSKRDLKTTHNAIRGCALLCFCFFCVQPSYKLLCAFLFKLVIQLKDQRIPWLWYCFCFENIFRFFFSRQYYCTGHNHTE